MAPCLASMNPNMRCLDCPDTIWEVEEPASAAEESDPEPPTKRVRGRFECEACGKSYTEQRTLNRHMRTPAHCEKVGSPGVAFPCGYCGKHFTRQDIRRRHEQEAHFNQGRSATRAKQRAGQSPAIMANAGPVDDGDIHEQSTLPAVEGFFNPVAHEADHSNLGSLSRPVQLGPDHQDPRYYHMDTGLVGYQSEIPAIATKASPEEKSYGSSDDSAEDVDMDTSPPLPELSLCSTDTEGSTEPSIEADDNASIPVISSANDDDASILSFSSLVSYGESVSLSDRLRRSRESLLRKGASSRPSATKRGMPCVLCRKPFGYSKAQIRTHIEGHILELQGEHTCTTCQVEFVQKGDLDMHMAAAARGHCGFDFEHVEPCQGHHKSIDSMGKFSDHDRLRLRSILPQWEGAQLHAFTRQISSMMADYDASPLGDCWSVHAYSRSRQSLSSLFGGLSIWTAPDPIELASHHTFKPRRGLRALLKIPTSQEARWKESRLQIVREVKAGRHPAYRELENMCVSGDIEGLRFALERPEEVHEQELINALFAATKEGTEVILQMLIDYRMDLNVECDSAFGTPLRAAVLAGNTVAMEYLLKAGASVDQKTRMPTGYETPIFAAIRNRDSTAVSVLLSYNASVFVRNEKGDTALAAACSHPIPDLPCIKILSVFEREAMIANGEYALALGIASNDSDGSVAEVLYEGLDFRTICQLNVEAIMTAINFRNKRALDRLVMRSDLKSMADRCSCAYKATLRDDPAQASSWAVFCNSICSADSALGYQMTERVIEARNSISVWSSTLLLYSAVYHGEKEAVRAILHCCQLGDWYRPHKHRLQNMVELSLGYYDEDSDMMKLLSQIPG